MIFDRLARSAGFDRPADSAMGAQMYGMPPAGVPVDEMTALKFGVVWACRKVITETVMTLPWGVYETVGDSRAPRPEHPVDVLLSRAPNPEMAAYAWKESIVGHALMQGNGYAEIERARNGDPLALWPLDPKQTARKRNSQNQLYFESRSADGRVTKLPDDDVYHIMGPSHDGLVGMSTIAFARDSISAAQAAERYGATFFGNGTVPGGIIQHASESKLQKFTGETLANFYESFEKRLKGSGKGSKVMYLDPGLTYQKISIDPDDAQFIETRKLSVPDICRWFRVPPHKVMDLEKATFSNIEHQSKEFVEDAIQPWVKRMEEEANRKLLDGAFYSRFTLQALLRGDSAARATYYRELGQMGVLTVNNMLALEDMNGIGPLGDKRMVPLNMTTLERLGESNENPVGD
jgi:HK97 family phage portal protein